MNKKIILILVVFLIVTGFAVATRFLGGSEGSWACQDGTWVKHGNPSSAEPETRCLEEGELELDTVKVYFSNSNMDPEFTCEKVFPVERKVIASKDMYYEAAVTELLNGPKEEEVEQGYGTGINSNVMIQKIEFADGVVAVDFNEQMEFQMGGSCRVLIIRKQIEETLKQFPEVKDVIISIDGRTEDILQP